MPRKKSRKPAGGGRQGRVGPKGGNFIRNIKEKVRQVTKKRKK